MTSEVPEETSEGAWEIHFPRGTHDHSLCSCVPTVQTCHRGDLSTEHRQLLYASIRFHAPGR